MWTIWDSSTSQWCHRSGSTTFKKLSDLILAETIYKVKHDFFRNLILIEQHAHRQMLYMIHIFGWIGIFTIPYWATTWFNSSPTINLSVINDIKIWFNEQHFNCTLRNEINMRLFKYCWKFMVFEVSRKTAIKCHTVNNSKIARYV